MIVQFGGVVQDDAGPPRRRSHHRCRITLGRFFRSGWRWPNRRSRRVSDPRDHEDLSWFVADWGVVTVGPFRIKGRLVNKDQELLARYRVIAHDGNAEEARIAGEFESYLKSMR